MFTINVRQFITFLLLLTPCLTVQAADGVLKITETISIKLPPGAFWINNHWPENKAELKPVRWRSSNQQHTNKEQSLNYKGLDNLSISGSASPSLANLYWLKKNVAKEHPVYVVDLRQETHLLINGLPISIFYKKDEINWGKTLAEINQEEQYWANTLPIQNTLEINSLGHPVSGLKVPVAPTVLSIKDAYTEAEATQKAGLEYFRIDVPDYHPPSPKQVDQFLQFVHTIPKNSWLHFHCAAGKGRTTLFMTMRDILANGLEIDLKDIIARQESLGGINLLGRSKSLSAQPWKESFHNARIDFIHLFYAYVHEGIYPINNFTQWLKKQPTGLYKSLLLTEAYHQ